MGSVDYFGCVVKSACIGTRLEPSAGIQGRVAAYPFRDILMQRLVLGALEIILAAEATIRGVGPRSNHWK